MKHYYLTIPGLLLFILVINNTLNAQQNKALLYMDKINRELNAIMVDTWDYTSEVAHGKSARMVEAKRKDLVRTSRLAIERVGKLDAFQGSTQYRDSVLSYLRINFIVLNKDYEKILDMEAIAEQSYDKMEAYLLAQELAWGKLDSAADKMHEQEEIFAAANHINLLENKDKVSKKLEKAGDVIKHYNVVYLIFFKSFKQEAYMVDAMNKKDINAMEQNKNALIAATGEGLSKLKTMLSFKSDKSLIGAARSALEFYQSEATAKMETIFDFYMRQENFEKVKNSFNSKPQSGRTSEDAKQYNDAVRDFLPYINAFNRINDEVNKNRTLAINNWNNTAKNFMDRHIPRYK